MAISAAQFPSLLNIAKGASGEFYVTPEVSTGLGKYDDYFGYMKKTLGSDTKLPGVTTLDQQVATAGQTAFTLVHPYVLGDSAKGLLKVWVAGVLKAVTTDYVETNTTTVTFNSGLTVGTVVKFYVTTAPTLYGLTVKNDGATPSVLSVGDKTKFDAVLKGVAEVTPVTMRADAAGDLNNKYWTLNSTTTAYYVWYNVNAAGVDPAIAGKTPIPVAVATGATNAAVATATAAAINALADFACPAPGAEIITVTDAIQGVAVDAADGNVGGLFAVGSITQGQGLNGAYIPA